MDNAATMSLRAVNLNLMPILQMLLRERSVAGAAQALDLSPTATSEALGRLRALLDDPLLVRVGRSMQLTPRALALIEPVNRLCDTAEHMLHRVETGFDPLTSRRQFKIASNDLLVSLAAKPLLEALRTQAPAVQVQFSDALPDVAEHMSAREVDLLLMPRIFTDHMSGSSPIRFRKLYADRLVLVFSARHPLAQRAELVSSDLAAYPQVLYNPTSPATPLEGRRERETLGGVPFNVVARVAQLVLIPPLVADPPYVAWLPASLVASMPASMQLQTRHLPFSAPSLDVSLAWSAVFDTDPAHAWFRRLVVDTLAHD